MKTLSCDTISLPARFNVETNAFETIDIIADIENDRIELVTEDKKDTVKLDLIGAENLGKILHGIINGKQFQAELREKIVKHTGRYHAVNSSAR